MTSKISKFIQSELARARAEWEREQQKGVDPEMNLANALIEEMGHRLDQVAARNVAPSVDPERVAQLIAHRACCGTEHDPANGKLHGYCVVCGSPWPCEYSGKPPAKPPVAPSEQGERGHKSMVAERDNRSSKTSSLPEMAKATEPFDVEYRDGKVEHYPAEREARNVAPSPDDVREEIRDAIITDQATCAGDYSEAEDYAARIVGPRKAVDSGDGRTVDESLNRGNIKRERDSIPAGGGNRGTQDGPGNVAPSEPISDDAERDMIYRQIKEFVWKRYPGNWNDARVVDFVLWRAAKPPVAPTPEPAIFNRIRNLRDWLRDVAKNHVTASMVDALLMEPLPSPPTEEPAIVCKEILEIMRVYHDQEKSSYGVDTPGGLEHMGDVWELLLKWEKLLLSANPLPSPPTERLEDK